MTDTQARNSRGSKPLCRGAHKGLLLSWCLLATECPDKYNKKPKRPPASEEKKVVENVGER